MWEGVCIGVLKTLNSCMWWSLNKKVLYNIVCGPPQYKKRLECMICHKIRSYMIIVHDKCSFPLLCNNFIVRVAVGWRWYSAKMLGGGKSSAHTRNNSIFPMYLF